MDVWNPRSGAFSHFLRFTSPPGTAIGATASARLNADSTLAVSASADWSVKLWNACSGAEIDTLPHRHIVRLARFSPEGDRVATAGREKLLRIYDVEVRGDPVSEFAVDIDAAYGQYLGANTILYGGSESGKVGVIDRRTGAAIATMDVEAGGVNDLRLQGNTLLVSAGKVVSFWDMDSYGCRF